jgi:hypothetical protein
LNAGNELADFGCCGVSLNQQAPGFAINRASFDSRAQGFGNQRLNGHEPGAGLLEQPGQVAKGRRVFDGLVSRDRTPYRYGFWEIEFLIHWIGCPLVKLSGQAFKEHKGYFKCI